MKQIAILLILICSSFLAYPQGDIRSKLYDVDLILKHASDINLTEEKAEAIKMIYLSCSKELAKRRPVLYQLEQEFKQAIDDSLINKIEVMQLYDQVLALQKEVAQLEISALIKMKTLLTVDQQNKLKEYHSEIQTFESELLKQDVYQNLVLKGDSKSEEKNTLTIYRAGAESIETLASRKPEKIVSGPYTMKSWRVLSEKESDLRPNNEAVRKVMVISVSKRTLTDLKNDFYWRSIEYNH